MITGPHIRSYHIFRKDSGKPESYERTVYGVLLMVEDKGFQEPIPSGAAQREVLIADRGFDGLRLLHTKGKLNPSHFYPPYDAFLTSALFDGEEY